MNCFDSVSNPDDTDTEIESHNSSEYFSGNAETKCQDKVTSDQFKSAILDEYKEFLSGIGKLEGEINITVKQKTVPYVTPVCRVAQSLQEPLKREFDKLIKQVIIVPFRNRQTI